ncbi:hypothetical protein Tco_0689515 [Tanacetum coccineum]
MDGAVTPLKLRLVAKGNTQPRIDYEKPSLVHAKCHMPRLVGSLCDAVNVTRSDVASRSVNNKPDSNRIQLRVSCYIDVGYLTDDDEPQVSAGYELSILLPFDASMEARMVFRNSFLGSTLLVLNIESECWLDVSSLCMGCLLTQSQVEWECWIMWSWAASKRLECAILCIGRPMEGSRGMSRTILLGLLKTLAAVDSCETAGNLVTCATNDEGSDIGIQEKKG